MAEPAGGHIERTHQLSFHRFELNFRALLSGKRVAGFRLIVGSSDERVDYCPAVGETNKTRRQVAFQWLYAFRIFSSWLSSSLSALARISNAARLCVAVQEDVQRSRRATSVRTRKIFHERCCRLRPFLRSGNIETEECFFRSANRILCSASV